MMDEILDSADKPFAVNTVAFYINNNKVIMSVYLLLPEEIMFSRLLVYLSLSVCS